MLWLLGTFPFGLWLFELLIRWMLGADDTRTFLGPAIASAAIGLLGPVAVTPPRYPWNKRGSARGPTALLFGIIGWCFCLAINIKRQVPPILGEWMSPLGWQFVIAIGMYAAAVVLTVLHED